MSVSLDYINVDGKKGFYFLAKLKQNGAGEFHISKTTCKANINKIKLELDGFVYCFSLRLSVKKVINPTVIFEQNL